MKIPYIHLDTSSPIDLKIAQQNYQGFTCTFVQKNIDLMNRLHEMKIAYDDKNQLNFYNCASFI